MRITNIDTLSALLDRLITERIKHFFFKKDNDQDRVTHQEAIIESIKLKISELLKEIYYSGEYVYQREERTFKIGAIVEELEDLIQNDINIGESDRERLKEIQSEDPNINKLIVNEKRLRKSNEGRGKNKNTIDSLLDNITRLK